MLVIIYAILLFIIIGSIIAVEAKDFLSSIISLGTTGIGLGVLFLLMRAPDIAITQVVVEVITLIILIRQAVRVRRDQTVIYRYGDVFNTFIAIIFVTIFTTIAYFFFIKYIPEFGHPLMTVSKEYIATGLEKTGSANIVTSILLDFRGYDTLGEATVLFVAILGAIVILRKHGRKKEER